MRVIGGLILCVTVGLVPASLWANGGDDWAASRDDAVRAYIASYGAHVPSFARQTGLACSSCHYQFLALTPFGRRFKLNGYTLTSKPSVTENDTESGGKLNLNPTSMVSGMITASLTDTKDDVPDTQNDATLLPQELSVFLAGRITDKVGMFTQFTYGGADGEFGIDNIDVRYANQTTVGNGTDLTYGVTLNNNPTVQDLWNTTPAWGFPYTGSEGAPTGAAGSVIDGGLEQNVLGLGGYALLGNLVYGEVTVYRSAFQGSAAPSSATGAIHGVAPYWRLGLQKEWEKQYLMIGTFGMHTSMFPDALTGPRDGFTDVGVDGQFETAVGSGNLVARGTWIHERQTLDATMPAGGSANRKNTLNTFRFNTSYYPRQWLGLTGGYFQTTGTTDAVLYAPGPVDGSATGDPKTRGFIGEVDLNPWENTRLGVQYLAYSRFNGLSTNYDGFGRDASGNNTLFLFLWLAF